MMIYYSMLVPCIPISLRKSFLVLLSHAIVIRTAHGQGPFGYEPASGQYTAAEYKMRPSPSAASLVTIRRTRFAWCPALPNCRFPRYHRLSSVVTAHGGEKRCGAGRTASDIKTFTNIIIMICKTDDATKIKPPRLPSNEVINMFDGKKCHQNAIQLLT